jgi:D-galactarolactone cycloisomerase
LKISAVKAHAEAIPLPRPFHGSNYVYTAKKAVFIEIDTDAGIQGYCYLGDDFGLGNEIAGKINQDIGPALLGADPLNVQDHWQWMRGFCRDILADRRVALHAQALVDICLWDIVGKERGQPLAAVFGEAPTARPVIAVAGYYAPGKTLADLADEALELIRLGCAGMKLKVGGAELGQDTARVQAIRRAAGPEFLLAVDANQAWSLGEAKEFLAQTADENLYWLEEPVHWDNDVADLATLRAGTDVPICAGQSEWSVAGAKRLIEAGAIDICNLHPGYSGGVTP